MTNPINTFNYITLIKELEMRRFNLTYEINSPTTDDKTIMQKEIVKINSILNNMTDYKIKFMDEQPAKPIKETKKSKTKIIEMNYGISGLINK
jgi:hypothetical protein